MFDGTSAEARALLAILLRDQDIREGLTTQTPDVYLGQAQQWLESSYLNYKHPAHILDPDAEKPGTDAN